MTIEEAKVIKVTKAKTLTSLMFFTRYFFRHSNRRKWELNDHHIQICNVLDDVVSGKIKRLIINIAPRYSKTELAVKNFIAYGLALNPSAKFIHLSYANELALDNSEAIKELVKSDAYQQLFPYVEIKQRTDSKKKWYTTKDGGVYATSTGGQVTGFGAGKVDESEDMEDFFSFENDPENFNGALILDDSIKPEDADSTLQREKVNKRFDSTLRNRVNSRNTAIIIIGQRLHENDLPGYLLANEPDQWHVLSLPCIKADGTALWSFKHTLSELLKMQIENPVVFARQYQQKADAITGKLYKSFRTYRDLPAGATTKKSVTDTADEGKDYLCNIIYSPTPTGYYLLDVYYTQDGMEITEERTAQKISAYGVSTAKVESNNGGRGFARNVERICKTTFDNIGTTFKWFHQSENKFSRIFTRAANVQNMIYYPENWETMWPLFAKAIKAYLSEGNNAHDDGPDALTMIIEEEQGTKVFGYSV